MTSTAPTFDAYVRLLMRSRAFALANPPPDGELSALLELGEAAALLDPALAIELSSVTTPWLRSVFPPDEHAIVGFRTVSGLRFSVDASDVFAATVAAGHLREARDFEAFMRLVRPGAVVVDVGANFGLYAVSAALYARPAGQVFAFEPAPGAFALLERNIAENGVEVTAIAAAIGAARARATLHVARDVSFSSLYETNRLRDATPVEVEVATLDAALVEVRSIDLLKIDVEGGEAAVLAGAREVLERSPRAIVQFEYSHKNLSEERRRDLRDVIGSLQPLGFKVIRGAAAGSATGLPALGENFSGNLFLVREGESERRLRDAFEKSNRPNELHANLAALALLKRQAEQKRALREADSVEKVIAEIADSVLGAAAPEGPVEAVRAVQMAWIETRKRASDAEGAAHSLAASLEGRDRLAETHSEKIAALRQTIISIEGRLEGAEAERDRLIQKVAELRSAQNQATQQIEAQMELRRSAEAASQQRLTAVRTTNESLLARNAQLQAGLKVANDKLAALRQGDADLRRILEGEMQKRNAGDGNWRQRLEGLREANAKLLERNAQLEAALKASNAKIAAMRDTDGALRARLHELMAQHKTMQLELARVRNVAKRMVDRYEALRADAGAPPDEISDNKAEERTAT